MRSLLSTLQEPPVATALTLAGSAAMLNLVSVTLGIIGAVIAIGYTVYRWRRDARDRTCDVPACPLRHRPE